MSLHCPTVGNQQRCAPSQLLLRCRGIASVRSCLRTYPIVSIKGPRQKQSKTGLIPTVCNCQFRESIREVSGRISHRDYRILWRNETRRIVECADGPTPRAVIRSAAPCKESGETSGVSAQETVVIRRTNTQEGPCLVVAPEMQGGHRAPAPCGVLQERVRGCPYLHCALCLPTLESSHHPALLLGSYTA